MTFKWPWQYDFPPFFTLQRTLVTREKQLEAWGQLVTDYAQHSNLHTIDLVEVSSSELFYNQRLNRRLNKEGVRAVFEHLENKKHIEWLDASKNRCHIYWRRPEEWGALIYEWAVSNGLLNTPCTIYEISHGDDTVGESFHGLEKELLLKSLRTLEVQRRAQLINIGSDAEVLLPVKCDSIESISSVSDPNAPSFFKLNERIEEGDTVIIYVNFGSTYSVVVKRGLTLTMKFGALRHEFIIGKLWGSKVSATAGYVYVLRPTAELWTRSLPRRTQILYTHDNALILQLLDARPGSVICESGTGSGSLSHAIGLAISPSGHLYTHDIEESRTRKIEAEFKEHGLSDFTTAVVQNVCTDGFFVSNSCDGVFLDVPSPWDAIPHAVSAISKTRGGRLVSFSPCIEQVQRAADAMRRFGFVQIETVECVPRTFKLVEQRSQSLDEFEDSGEQSVGHGNRSHSDKAKKRKLDSEGRSIVLEPQVTAITFPINQPTHTGYLTHATLLPRE